VRSKKLTFMSLSAVMLPDMRQQEASKVRFKTRLILQLYMAAFDLIPVCDISV